MDRRNFLKQFSQGAALAGLVCSAGKTVGAQPALKESNSPSGNRSPLKITKVKAILTAPARIRLCVVKVETSEPGLYGVGLRPAAAFARHTDDEADNAAAVQRPLSIPASATCTSLR